MPTSSEHKPDTWLFGYGSLIWRPAFDYEEKRAWIDPWLAPALLAGVYRSPWSAWCTRTGRDAVARRERSLLGDGLLYPLTQL